MTERERGRGRATYSKEEVPSAYKHAGEDRGSTTATKTGRALPKLEICIASSGRSDTWHLYSHPELAYCMSLKKRSFAKTLQQNAAYKNCRSQRQSFASFSNSSLNLPTCSRACFRSIVSTGRSENSFKNR